MNREMKPLAIIVYGVSIAVLVCKILGRISVTIACVNITIFTMFVVWALVLGMHSQGLLGWLVGARRTIKRENEEHIWL